jgi:hypothetical protein
MFEWRTCILAMLYRIISDSKKGVEDSHTLSSNALTQPLVRDSVAFRKSCSKLSYSCTAAESL